METKVYAHPSENEIECIGELLREGKLVAIPTETVYGLGANGLDETALSAIYEAKGRPSDNPLILHVSGVEEVYPLVQQVTPTAQKLMERFWPGPLTITLEKSNLVPFRATGGLPRVALRCPDNDICRKIIKAAKVPIAAPSANRSGRPSPTTAAGVFDDMKGRITAVVDDGPCRVGIESTVVECGVDEVTILRPGEVTEEMLLTVVSKVNWDPAIVSGEGRPKAPGMKYKHYAPDADMRTFVGSASGVAHHIWREYLSTAQPSESAVGVLISHETFVKLEEIMAENQRTLFDENIVCIDFGSRDNPEGLAHILYEALHRFNVENVALILAEGTEIEGVGTAIMNRMVKASSRQVFYVDAKGNLINR